jgi:hypothetical protein
MRLLRPLVQSYLTSLRELSNDPRCGTLQPALGSADSFASAQSITTTITYLNSCSEKVSEILTIVDRFLNQLTLAVNNTNWSQSDKESFLTGVKDGSASGRQDVAEYVEAETKFLNATSQWYQFALENQTAYRFSGDKLLFSNERGRRKFNSLADEYEANRLAAAKAKTRSAETSKTLLEKVGVKMQDLGFADARH